MNTNEKLTRASALKILAEQLKGKVPTKTSQLTNDSGFQTEAQVEAAITGKGYQTDTQVAAAISGLRTELMGEGVPEAYDTFKELADYIEGHQDASDALTAAIGDKVSKEDGKGLSSNDYTNEDKAKVAGLEFATDEEITAMIAEVFGA